MFSLAAIPSIGLGQPVDLGTLGGSFSEGTKINSNGIVIGSSTLANGDTSAFVGDASGIQALGLGGSFSVANDINDAGVVVGGSYTADDSDFQAFAYVNGAMRTISLGGSRGMALDVNENGQVAGYSALPGDTAVHGFLYDIATDQITDLNTLGGTDSFATELNDSGQVIGFSFTANDTSTQAFRYSNGTLLALTLGGSSFASDINAQGQVVGASQGLTGVNFHAFLFDGVQTIDLVGLGGSESEAVGISEQGFVAGTSDLAGDTASNAFIYTGLDICPLSLGGDSVAMGINRLGDVLGESFTAGNADYHAFLYSDGLYTHITLGGPSTFGLDLNSRGDVVGTGNLPGSSDFIGYRHTSAGTIPITLGGPTGSALDINENGDATGGTTLANGDRHAFLLPFNSDTTPPVTTLTVSPQPNAAGWHNQSVTVTLTAQDEAGGSGVKEVVYQIGADAPVVTAGSSVSFLLSNEGIHAIKYFARDNAGNTESEKTHAIRIDKTIPSLTATVNTDTLWPPDGQLVNVTVIGSATDSLSGVASASFRVIDEYGQFAQSGGITLSQNGAFQFVLQLEASRLGEDLDGRQYKIEIKAADVADNNATLLLTVIVPHDQGIIP